jgi:hypothetical protein
MLLCGQARAGWQQGPKAPDASCQAHGVSYLLVGGRAVYHYCCLLPTEVTRALARAQVEVQGVLGLLCVL